MRSCIAVICAGVLLSSVSRKDICETRPLRKPSRSLASVPLGHCAYDRLKLKYMPIPGVLGVGAGPILEQSQDGTSFHIAAQVAGLLNTPSGNYLWELTFVPMTMETTRVELRSQSTIAGNTTMPPDGWDIIKGCA